MSITQALNASLSGLRATQAGISLIASNVANAQTAGYVRKTMGLVQSSAGDTSSVRIGTINRELDQYLQRQLRVETAGGAYADLRADFYSRLQGLYGAPGSDSSLETAFNNFTSAAQSLVTNPDSAAARSVVLSSGQVLAQTLNSLTTDIQGLRGDAENSLADSVAAANDAFQKITDLNTQLAGVSASSASTAALEDQRDSYIDQLSQLMDIRVIKDNRDQVTIFTNSGVQLVSAGAGPAKLSFNAQGTVTPSTQWDSDPAKSTMGSLLLVAANGSSVDLIANQSIRSGKIAALLEMRDHVLVQAQDQIDGLAAAMSQALSDTTIAGTPETSGPQNGFSVDTAGLQNGNRISLTYTDNLGRTQHKLSIIRVDDPTALPLDNSATADPNDEVVGLDFSGGIASVISQLNTLYGPGLQFDNPSGNVLRVLDDGSGGTTVNALSLTQTETTLASGNPAIGLFTDGSNPFTGAISGTSSQTLGLAGRISVNSALLADPSKLVLYATGTETGDPTRPNLIFDRLTSAVSAFSPDTGLGNASTPYNGTVGNYLRQVLSMQGEAASSASSLSQGQDVVVNALKQRFTETSGVNVDQEMANLITLQTAYGANARVMSAMREIIDQLLKM